jgi:hypothetical protein
VERQQALPVERLSFAAFHACHIKHRPLPWKPQAQGSALPRALAQKPQGDHQTSRFDSRLGWGERGEDFPVAYIPVCGIPVAHIPVCGIPVALDRRHPGFAASETSWFCCIGDILVLLHRGHPGFAISSTSWFCHIKYILVLTIPHPHPG